MSIRGAAAMFVVVSWAGFASAQDDGARELFNRGEAAYETGDYETAVRLWSRAYELDDRPALQYNLAQAHERLGNLAEAVRSYRLYVDRSPGNDPRAPNARARLAALEQRLGSTGILLRGGVEGARVLVDGDDRGRLPRPDAIAVEPGSHQVTVRADGYRDFVSTVAVNGGQRLEIPVSMVRGQSGSSGSGVSTVGVVIASLGAALAISGAVVAGLALDAASSAPDGDGSQADDARAMALAADILLPVGGTAIAAGLVLMFALEADLGAQAHVTPLIGPAIAGFSVDGTF